MQTPSTKKHPIGKFKRNEMFTLFNSYSEEMKNRQRYTDQIKDTRMLVICKQKSQ